MSKVSITLSLDIVGLPINLTDQKEPRLNFHTEEIINTNNSNKIDYCKKIIQPTEDELENYKVFMKKSLKKIV